MRLLLMGLWAVFACGGTAEPEQAEPDVPERCKKIHVDRLAGDWVAVRGNAADPKTRMRVMEKDGGYEAWFIGGVFARTTMKGDKRDKDIQFTEIPNARRKKFIDAGEADRARVYVEPSLGDCALKVFIGSVDLKDKEKIPPTAVEFMPFPEQEGVTFSFRPADGPAFLGKAASDGKTAKAQLDETGGGDPVHEMGTVPVGTFSDAAADGDEGCTYDMDLYFDDLKVNEHSPKAAGAVENGRRHWYHEWEAPFSGNHHFELYRYRTCDGGERSLIGVSAIEAVLQ